MAITSAIVLYAVIWFIVLFVVLPLNLISQGEADDVVPGTHKSAPMNPDLKRKAKIVTLVSLPIWIVSVALIATDWVTLADLDLYQRFGPGNSPVFPED